MSALRDALKDLKTAVLETCDEASLTRQQALLQITLVALKQLESGARELTAGDADHVEGCAEAAKEARKSLKQFRVDAPAPGTKRSRAVAESAETAGAPSSSPQAMAGANDLHLGQYSTTDAFDGNERKKNKFARLLGGGKGTAVSQTHNTVVASSASVKEMNRVLESQYEDALKRGRKKGLGA